MTTLPFTRVESLPNADLPWSDEDLAITQALEGDPVGPPPRFRLLQSPESLLFTVGCARPAWNDLAKAKPKAFLANLWKQDVGELFLSAPDSKRYLEINLSPYGAWWACVFSDSRQANADIALPKIPETRWKVDPDAWLSTMTIPLAYLRSTLDFGERSKANVCFILGPADARRHFSWAPMPPGPPNFHRRSDFLPVTYGSD